MLEDLIEIHENVIANTHSQLQRYLYEEINWQNQATCIVGPRGVGKTTLMCQAFLELYNDPRQGLYISADNLHVLSNGLFAIAREYFKFGGQALFIDEVHKYPNWSMEIKNILDTYKNKKIVFSASSALALEKSKYDLSRRVVYYELKGLSFREYLLFNNNLEFSTHSLEAILQNHTKIADEFKNIAILKYFHEYLSYGYYPFMLEGKSEYLHKVNNIIEKVLYEDIAVVYNLKQTTITILKKLLWLIATSNGLIPNIDKISRNLRISRIAIYNCFEYLDHAGLIKNIYHDAIGSKLVRKPGKIYLENTNLLASINGSIKFTNDLGGIRETFFVNQFKLLHVINLAKQGDFIIDKNYIFEVGGKSKKEKQIERLENAFLVKDDLEIGFGDKIPLYLFGFLY